MKFLRFTTNVFTLVLFLITASFAQWTEQDPGLPADMNAMFMDALDANTVWVVGGRLIDQPLYQGYSVTNDGGNTWATGTIPGAASFFFSGVFVLDQNTVWVSLLDNANRASRIYKTTDGGQNWTHQNSAYNVTPSWSNFVYFFNENEGVTVGDQNDGYVQIYTTTDGGDNWTRVPKANIPYLLEISEQGLHSNYTVAGDSSMWWGTNRGRIFYTTDRGKNWKVSNPALGSNAVYPTFQDELIGLATTPGADSLVAKTTDGGATWQILPDKIFGSPLLRYVEGSVETYMYTVPFGASGFSFDGGSTWRAEDAAQSFMYGEFVDPATGWANSMENNKIYKWSGDPLVSAIAPAARTSVPERMELEQNYPNPFNPSTTIRFSLAVSGYTELRVYDVVGKEVAMIVAGNLNAGSHEYQFNSGSLASGLYYYQLVSGEIREVKKMILLR